MKIRPCIALLLAIATLILSGCMTTGYSVAKDPNAVGKWEVTIISIEDQNIYNSLGVSLVGPLAPVDNVGQRIAFVDRTGKKQEIVQPKGNRYTLKAGQTALYIVDRGQVWVQPLDYPLPPEFTH